MSSSVPEPGPGEITRLLTRAQEGDAEALDELFPLVYDVLRAISRKQLQRESGEPILSTTELVHEAYLKLAPGGQVEWQDRIHFYRVAARAMRQVLVERARRRAAEKRGGGRWTAVTLEEHHVHLRSDPLGLLALDEALQHLGRRSDRLLQVVELRFFAGLSEQEIAATLGLSTRTVERDWEKARLFLHQTLHPAGPVP